MVYQRSGRMLSQRNYQLVQEIRDNAERIRQIDQGLRYAPPTVSRQRVSAEGRALPLHLGPELELTAEEVRPEAA